MTASKDFIARTQSYWDGLPEDRSITAEEIYNRIRSVGEHDECLTYIRGFLTRKFNAGNAFLVPGQSPPTYFRMDKVPSGIAYCTRVFNSLEAGTELTTVSLRNRLPQALKETRCAPNFINRAKLIGALKVVKDNETGEIAKRDRCNIVQKLADIDPDTFHENYRLAKQGKAEVAAGNAHAKEVIDKRKDDLEKMAKAVFDMTPSEAGMLLFEYLHSMTLENENLRSTMDALKEQNEALVLEVKQ